ncbi:MAG: SDR family oxidoreductase [Parvularculaceae bacterium]|nr:SDR family oxidoreductase [Parvularculaceae bacterium]
MTNRSVIVAGAASAIGSACARRFIANGDRVVLADEDEETLRNLSEELSAKGAAVFVTAGVSNKLAVHNIIAEALEAYGAVDALVNAKMEVDSGEFLELTEESFDAAISANLRGAFILNQAVCRQFKKQLDASVSDSSDAAIVNIMSVEAVTVAADRVAFAVAQGGLHQLTKAVALAMSPTGVRVNAVGIGAIKSDYMKDFEFKSARETVPLNRIGDPEDPAEAAFFLASPAASYITGQTIFVDGGRLVRSGAADYVEKNSD